MTLDKPASSVKEEGQPHPPGRVGGGSMRKEHAMSGAHWLLEGV